MTINWFVMATAGLQLAAAVWAGWFGDWKMAVVNGSLSVANVVFSTMAKA